MARRPAFRSYPTTEQYSNIPIPDPSEITAREIARATADLRAEFEQKLKAGGDLAAYRYEERTRTLDAIRQTMIEYAKNQREMMEEKLLAVRLRFESVDLRFSERDIRHTAMAESSKEAISAALTSQKELAALVQNTNSEAIHKSETSYGSRLAALETLLYATKDQMLGRVSDLSSRMDRAESVAKGAEKGTETNQANVASVLGIVGGIAAVLLLVATILIGFHSPTPQVALSSSSPTAAIDSKRLDDLVDRLNAMSERLDSLAHPLTPPVVPGSNPEGNAKP
jgi:hypothetical protein